MMKRMGKAAFLYAVLLSLICLVIPGCGGAAGIQDAALLDAFFSARDEFKLADSYRMVLGLSASYEMSEEFLQMGLDSVDMNIEFSYEMLFEQTRGGGKIAKLVVPYEEMVKVIAWEPGGSYDSPAAIPPKRFDFYEAYATEEEFYYQDEMTGEWKYEKNEPGEDFFSSLESTPLSPAVMMEALEGADEVAVLEETDTSITYELIMDFSGLFGETGDPGADLIGGRAMVTVDRVSCLPVRIIFVNEGSYSDFENLLDSSEEYPPEFLDAIRESTYRYEMFAEISDYGADFDIQLPEEAKKAKTSE